jgi:hypothetical protein
VNTWLGIAILAASFVGMSIGGRFGTMFIKEGNVTEGLGKYAAIAAAVSLPFCFLAFMTESFVWHMVFLCVAMMFFFSVTSPINLALLTSAPAHLSSTAMAVSNLAVHAFGDSLSTSMVGIMSDYGYGLKFSLQILPVMLFISIWAWYPRKRHPIPRPKAVVTCSE